MRRHLRWAVPSAGVLLAAVLTVVIVTQVGGNAACAAPISGKASYYSTNRNGMCNLGAPSTDSYVAIGPAEYAGGAACGSYLSVTGPNGTTVLVQVVDQCPSCPRGKIDLSKAAFARIGELSAGIIPITYDTARDPALTAPLRVKLKGGTSRSSLTAVVDNHGNPLASVELQTPAGWTPLKRGSDNVWTGPSGQVAAPVTLRVTDVFGHQAVVPGLTPGPSEFQQTQVALYGPGASPSPSPSASPSAEPSPTASTVPAGVVSALPSASSTC
ncbi:expansin EXLX1 family cellulose-binding protein [Dactylosporangium sp. NPDC005572]|uniref:expansin EXLX1 family cellulose-binding protein n=1 Tax=Dactylosporangium sp. NPDC005572 TaxID=3156889 RepID=UPI0033AE7E4D